MSKKTIVTLSASQRSFGFFKLKIVNCAWVWLDEVQTNFLFGARIVNKVRKANGKPVKVKLTAEVMK